MSLLLRKATIEPMGPAGGLVLSDQQVQQLGGGKRAAVVVSIDGRSARLRLAVMGGLNLIGLSKANRELLGVQLGQVVDAEIVLDQAPREVTVPAELASALAAEPQLKGEFDRLAYTHQREFSDWIGSAKQAGTRQRRVEQTLDMLRRGEHR